METKTDVQKTVLLSYFTFEKSKMAAIRHFKFLFNGYNSVANSLLRAIVEIKIRGILLKLSSHCYSSSDS